MSVYIDVTCIVHDDARTNSEGFDFPMSYVKTKMNILFQGLAFWAVVYAVKFVLIIVLLLYVVFIVLGIPPVVNDVWSTSNVKVLRPL